MVDGLAIMPRESEMCPTPVKLFTVNLSRKLNIGGVSFCTVCSGIMQWHNAAHYSLVSLHMLITYFVIEDTMP